MKEFRMTIRPAIEAGNYAVCYEFETAEQMLCAEHVASNLLLFLQDKAKVMKDYSNLFILEEFIENCWEEYEEF